MATTALFVEILVVGVQALLWLGLLLSVGYDFGPVLMFLRDYKEYAALITTVLLAVAYALGIFIDRAADSFFTSFLPKPDKRLKSLGKVRLRILRESESMAKFLDYQRSRLRIARSTVFNLFLMIITASVWVLWRGRITAPYLWTIFAGIVAFVIAVIVAFRIDKAQMDRLADAYEIITEKRGD